MLAESASPHDNRRGVRNQCPRVAEPFEAPENAGLLTCLPFFGPAKHPVTSASPNSISVEPLQLPDRNLTVNDSVQ